MTRAERLNEAFQYLRGCGKIHSQKDLAQAMGATAPNVSSALKGVDKVLTEKFLRRFVEAFDNVVSFEWLLTGEGEMLKPKSEPDASNAKLIGGIYSAGEKDDATILVEFVPVTASASFIESLVSGVEPELDKIPLIPSGNERSEASKLRVFEVEGDSMFPTIPSGALILAKEIPESSWHYAEGVVVAVYGEFVVVKRVARNCLLTDNYLSLKSDNEGYGEMIVALSDIRALYKAKRIISSEIR